MLKLWLNRAFTATLHRTRYRATHVAAAVNLRGAALCRAPAQHNFFVSFITWVSLAGRGVGVAALIVILSVMNGFEDELRDRLLSLTAHARIVAIAAHDRAQGQVGSALRRAWRGSSGVLRASLRTWSCRRWQCARRRCCP